MYFDTHAHYDFYQFDEDREQLFSTLLPEAGVSLVLNPGCDYTTSELAIQNAESCDYVYAAIGWHPNDATEFRADSADYLRTRARHPKVKAIGEIGLDYYRSPDNKELQKQVFRTQLEVARELNLPVIVHDREAHQDSLDIISEFPDLIGVFHCYSGSAEMAKEILKLGWYLSFTGAITFKNARKTPEVIEAIPLDRIMIETDSPYLTPDPFRSKRNDSRYLPLVAKKIAEIRGIETEEVARITKENGKRLFNI